MTVAEASPSRIRLGREAHPSHRTSANLRKHTRKAVANRLQSTSAGARRALAPSDDFRKALHGVATAQKEAVLGKTRFITFAVLPFVVALASGAARAQTVRPDWPHERLLRATGGKNTRAAYEKVIRRTSDPEVSAEAGRRLADPVYAFLMSWYQGDERFIREFRSLHPDSNLTPVASEYLQFLKETRSLKQASRFVASQPQNPFTPLARAVFPLLWLEEQGQPVGVTITIGDLLNKGLLGGSNKQDKVLARARDKVRIYLRDRVSAVFFDTPDAVEGRPDIALVINVHYSETRPARVSTCWGPTVADNLNCAAANNLTNMIWNPANDVFSITVTRIPDVVLYTNVPGWNSSARAIAAGPEQPAQVNLAEVLAAGPNKELLMFLVGLKGRSLSDPAEREDAYATLNRVAGNRSDLTAK